MALFVYGGSFNPPHLAHVLALCVARSQAADFEGALVVPTFHHPLGKDLAPFEDRVAMATAAMGWIPGVTISRIEEELGGDSRTLRTLQELQNRHPGRTFRLLVGADILLERAKWHAFDEIARIAPPFVLGRVGIEHEEAPVAHLPDISSTAVREAAARGDWPAVAARVPALVLDYLRAHSLYEHRA